MENLIRSLPKCAYGVVRPIQECADETHTSVPGYSFLSLLKNDLNKARRDGLLPPSSRPSPVADPSQSQAHIQTGLGTSRRGLGVHHPSAPIAQPQPLWPWSSSPNGGLGTINGFSATTVPDTSSDTGLLPFNLNPDQNLALASMGAGFPWLNVG